MLGIARALLWLVWLWVVLDVVMLFLAFLLRLFGANPNAGFTEWVYRSVQRAMAPFRGIFEPIPLTDQSVLDTSLLFAMIVYGIVALFLHAGVDWLSRWMARRKHELAVEEARAMAAIPSKYPVPAPAPRPVSAYPEVVVPAAEPRPGAPLV